MMDVAHPPCQLCLAESSIETIEPIQSDSETSLFSVVLLAENIYSVTHTIDALMLIREKKNYFSQSKTFVQIIFIIKFEQVALQAASLKIRWLRSNLRIIHGNQFSFSAFSITILLF